MRKKRNLIFQSQNHGFQSGAATVKLGYNELFDKELHKDKEHLVLRNNFWATKKFLIAKFDCITLYLVALSP